MGGKDVQLSGSCFHLPSESQLREEGQEGGTWEHASPGAGQGGAGDVSAGPKNHTIWVPAKGGDDPPTFCNSVRGTLHFMPPPLTSRQLPCSWGMTLPPSAVLLEVFCISCPPGEEPTSLGRSGRGG